MKRRSLFLVVLLAFSLTSVACAVRKQHNGIKDARLAVEASAIAADTTDKTIDGLYGNAPPEDTVAYCRNKIAAFMLAQTRVLLTEALDAILLWEKALDTYETRKELGTSTDADWSDVLSSKSKWLDLSVSVIAAIDGVINMLKLWGIELPEMLDKVWGFLSGLIGRPKIEFAFTFEALKDSVCYEYLSGGGS